MQNIEVNFFCKDTEQELKKGMSRWRFSPGVYCTNTLSQVYSADFQADFCSEYNYFSWWRFEPHLKAQMAACGCCLYPVCYPEPTLIDKRSLMHLKEWLLLPEKVFQLLIKLCLGETAAYDNMMIFIRVDTVIYNHSITLFTWEMLLLETTAHLYVQFNMCN